MIAFRKIDSVELGKGKFASFPGLSGFFKSLLLFFRCSGISALWTAVLENGLVTGLAAYRTADRSEEVAAAWAETCVYGNFVITEFAEELGNGLADGAHISVKKAEFYCLSKAAYLCACFNCLAFKRELALFKNLSETDSFN